MGTQGNWMTPATISDISLNSLSQSTELSQSSLLFSVGKKLPSALKYGRKREQLKAVGPNFGKGKLELPATDGQIPGMVQDQLEHIQFSCANVIFSEWSVIKVL